MTSRNNMMRFVAPFMRRRMPSGPQYGPDQEFVSAQQDGGGGVLEYGSLPAKAFVDQADRAGNAMFDAYQDPTFRNLSLAGGHAAMAVPVHPWIAGAGLGAFGLGMGGAILDDSNILDGTAAAADSGLKVDIPLPEKITARDRAIALTGVDEEAERAHSLKELEIKTLAKAKGEAMVAAAAEKEKQAGDLAKQEASDVEAANRIKRETAATMRDSELAKAGSFYDTETGKFYRDMGGFAPIALGMGFGALSRAARGPASGAVDDYVMPWLVGTSGVLTGQNAPDLYDLSTPAYNPEKKAWRTYARELPPDDPNKQQAMDYAESLPEDNPVSKAAMERLSDPGLMARRFGLSMVEGLGGLVGADAVAATSRAGRSLASIPGSVAEGIGSLGGRYKLGKYTAGADAQLAKNKMFEAQARQPDPTPQGPSPAALSGTPTNPPALPAGGPPAPPPGPQPVPPKPPRGGQGGSKGGGNQRPSNARKNSILNDLAAGKAPQAGSAAEIAYAENLNNQAQSMANSLGIPKQDVLKSMVNAIATGARKTPYAIPAGMAAGTAVTDFDTMLEEYGQIVRDMDGDGDIDADDLRLMGQQ